MAVRLNPDRTVTEIFQRGLVRDMPPHVQPTGSVYDVGDFLFDRPGVAYKRGGTSAHSAAMGSATGCRTIAIIDPPDRIICVADDHNLYDVTSESAPGAVSIGSVGFLTSENPAYYNGKVILTDDNAQFSGLGVSPKKVEWIDPNIVLSNLGGSPPVAFRSCVHVSRIVLGRNFTNPNRIWFSPLPFAESTVWDLTQAYIDTTWEITGLASTQGVLLVFSSKAIERILGDIPPGTGVTDVNMQLQPLANVGCSDARSIVHLDSGVVFANPSGVYVTNSASVQSLTEKADGSGISSFWRGLFSSSNPRGIACGLMGRDYLKVDVFDPSTFNPIQSLLCYLPTVTWTILTNINGVGYATGNSVNNMPVSELYCAQGKIAKTIRLSSILKPIPENKLDADGKAVLPMLQTRVLEGTPWHKSWGHGSITLDLRDADVDQPVMNVEVFYGIDGFTGRTADGSPIAETSNTVRLVSGHVFPRGGALRREIKINHDTTGVMLRLFQSNPSAQTIIYSIDLDVRDYNTGAQRLMGFPGANQFG